MKIRELCKILYRICVEFIKNKERESLKYVVLK